MATAAAPTSIEAGARVSASRARHFSTAVFAQSLCMVFSLATILGHRSDDPLFFSRVPWRLPLLLSWPAYMSLLVLVQSHVGPSLPRAPPTSLAVDELLPNNARVVAAVVVAAAAVLNVMGSFVLGMPVQDSRVVMGCACFAGVLVAGLLGLWVWLVRQHGGGRRQVKLQLLQLGAACQKPSVDECVLVQ